MLAARAGADAIGLVCYAKAARYTALPKAIEIAQWLPPFVTPVALFVDPTASEVFETIGAIDIFNVQLHGRESAAFIRTTNAYVLKAIRVDRATFEQELDAWRRQIAIGGLGNLKGFVLESPGPGVGGTGVANDWDFVADVARRGGFEGLPPIIAAGGLTPENVGDVVRLIRPWAVDVSSGVERVKGEKDPELVERFIAAVREADRSISGR
jgi:phosphoribosylanthranilate isomerase